MSGQTQEQKRAAFALDRITKLSAKDLGNYASLVDGFPATVVMDGLGQALATLKAKGEPGTKILFRQIEEWLCRENDLSPYKGERDLLEAVMKKPQDSYVLAQAETLALLTWIKKLARAYLTEEKQA